MNVPIRHLALIGLLISVPVSAWAIGYRPMNNVVRSVAEEIRDRTRDLSHFDEVNAQYRELKTLTKQLDNSITQAKKRIPHRHNADQWLESASNAANDLGLVVRSVTTSGEHVEGEYRILPVDLNVSGAFESLYGLIQRLEQMERISRVQRMNIHRVDDTSVEARLVIHLVFSTEDAAE